MLFFPDMYFNKIWEITPELLIDHGIKGLCLDIDNTLTYDCDPLLPEESRDWIDSMSENEIKAIILSNNNKQRVSSFAKLCGLPYIYKAGKPSVKNKEKICKMLGMPPDSIALVGDQLFTDMLCARRCGFTALLCGRMGRDVQPFVILKRIPEALFMPFIQKKRRYRNE